MQELNITGKGIFNAAAGQVTKSDNNLECLLVLDGDKLGFGSNKNAKKGQGGYMFTSVKLKRAYEVTK